MNLSPHFTAGPAVAAFESCESCGREGDEAVCRLRDTPTGFRYLCGPCYWSFESARACSRCGAEGRYDDGWCAKCIDKVNPDPVTWPYALGRSRQPHAAKEILR